MRTIYTVSKTTAALGTKRITRPLTGSVAIWMPRPAPKQGNLNHVTSCSMIFLPLPGSLGASVLAHMSPRDSREPLSDEFPTVIASIEGWTVGEKGVNIRVDG